MDMNESMKRIEPECSEECTCDKRQVWNSAMDEVNRLQKYSNVLEKLMGSLDSRDEGDWILLENIDELMKAEGIPRGEAE
jgi:hypothetical protein